MLVVWLGIAWKKKMGSCNSVEENGLQLPSRGFECEEKPGGQNGEKFLLVFCCVKYIVKGVQLQNCPCEL